MSLITASRKGNLEYVRALLKRGARQDRLNRSLIEAAGAGHAEIVGWLLAAGADVHAGRDEALHRACTYGHVAVTDALLRAGADSRYALWNAVWHKHTDVVVCLLNAGIVDHNGRALCVAANRGLADMVALLAPYAHPTSLHTALSAGLTNAQIVAPLLAAGARIPPDALERVVCFTRPSIPVVRMLLAAGAGRLTDALAVAAAYGRAEIVELLLAAGAGLHGRSLRAAVTQHFAE